ncbi:CHAP domain-containing protein [Peiella sedimenti]|uniref:CHAP domain-containing protein n=1 Tax=Peiella sedimenti TaxID=3061083 RepID=UPI0031380B76
MMKRFGAALAALTLAISLAPAAPATSAVYWQCVTFARAFSGLQIFGDAWTWWRQATDRNLRTGRVAEPGAVLVFQPHGRMTRGHVAVVSQVMTERVVQVTHANWGGSRGRIERDVTMVDVSPEGDWSQVKVWHNPTGDLGTTVYPTYGFIYGGQPNYLQLASLEAQSGQSAQGQP